MHFYADHTASAGQHTTTTAQRGRLRLAAAFALAGLTVFAPLTATAAEWPTQPITIIVPFPAGGMTDVLARRLAQHMQDKLGQSVVVENRAGASGQIGSAVVARAKPDGYTLLVSATHHVINPAIRTNLPYDTRKDFTDLALMATTPNVLVVNKDVPANDLKSFSDYVNKHPGGVMFGSSSIGGATHLSGELLKLETGLKIANVPYKGAAPAMTDLLGGQIPALFHDITTMTPYVLDGRVKAIGVTSAQRSPALPNVPTIAEQGVPNYLAITWIGFYGPAGLPDGIAQKLNTLARESMHTKSALAAFNSNGTEPGDLDLPAFKAFVSSELNKWQDVVKRAGVKVE
ncbi:tripartite tricarboxylate transporter substrate binding protein [Pusillimonas sp. TS35]|uniref:Bug family tripartite tricarboxylate transporter substrate binding protein n=1 Tax=Paracandidimonas lactea TaxID=2895524 RepID=UPI00136F31EB|nr:tripartite tricarboxylate transporter substrate binding protein [Paracandidimonas lactea]MYN13478.1 tripartite tricarboxylate transporter substrate binding protein [Pusillimonas sp. TS35]